MDVISIEFSVADPEFYAPLAGAAVTTACYQPTRPARGWKSERSGIWAMWRPDGLPDDAEDGWKVHVSARPDRLREVLDAAAGVCFAQGVRFKHIAAPLFYLWSNHKYAPRPQAGKFIAAYPADVPTAWRLMEALREALAGEDGPYILSDRRFKDSRTVHYRYGAFISREQVQADGRRVLLVRDGNDRLVPDQRGVSFRLPAGVSDPFAEPITHAPGADDPIPLGGFMIESVIRHSNAGGTYRARHVCTGRRVFIKEARSHTGIRQDLATATQQLAGEWEILTELHAAAPGLAPEPVSYFREWEHEFLAMEMVPGIRLSAWMSVNHPILRAGSDPGDFATYYRRCEKILADVERNLTRLHDLGYLFVDVSPDNLLVGADDTVRLVDFDAAHRLGSAFTLAGTPGYTPPPSLVTDDLTIYDSYGVAALAQLMLGPLHQPAQRDPEVLRHLYFDLSQSAPPPRGLWEKAIRFHQPAGGTPKLPPPEQVATEPARHLAELRGKVADALIAMADIEHPDRVFPTIVEGYRTNTLCVAYGTAGVIHALRHFGHELPDGLTERFRRDALAQARSDRLGPGLHVGLAGIAWVLADLGYLGEAEDLLKAATRHPLTSRSATLYGGSAGVALAHIALNKHTGDDTHLGHAEDLARAMPPDDHELVPRLGSNDATGLMHGRCGIALMFQQLSAATGDHAALSRCLRLLHAELDRASDPTAPGLLFPASATDRRQMPYLYCGSAGLAFTATRYLACAPSPDERVTAALPRLLAPLHRLYTVMPGLQLGLAGYAFTLADHALITGDKESREAAIRAARGLYKYAIWHSTGVRFLGDQLLRYSADLWSGSAGILLALTHVLDPRPSALFTIDPLPQGAPRQSPPEGWHPHGTPRDRQEPNPAG